MADRQIMIKRHPVLLFCHPSMKGLAKQVVAGCKNTEASMKKKKVISREIEFVEGISWKKYTDGFPDIFVKEVKRMAGKDVLFLGSFHDPEVVFEQLSIIYAFPRFLTKSFTLILPYYPTCTLEEETMEGQLTNSKTLATILSSIPVTSKGPAQIIIYDIHNLQERNYFSNNVIPRLESGIPLLMGEIEEVWGEDAAVSYAFPDEAALKRLGHHFPDEDLIICNKVRDGNKKLVTVKGNPKGKDIVIVDDVIFGGHKYIECLKALNAGGAKSVSAYVTHAVFPEESWKKFLEEENKLSYFWITDSLPHAHKICKYKPFRLLSIGWAISDLLQGFDLLM